MKVNPSLTTHMKVLLILISSLILSTSLYSDNYVCDKLNYLWNTLYKTEKITQNPDYKEMLLEEMSLYEDRIKILKNCSLKKNKKLTNPWDTAGIKVPQLQVSNL